mgnify:CR=1 FL=1
MKLDWGKKCLAFGLKAEEYIFLQIRIVNIAVLWRPFHQVKLFDDHLTVESPGILPGLVRTYNIREVHFSRNPKVAEYMHVYKFVKEYGEGVDRIFREMQESGCPEPIFRQVEFLVKATIQQHESSLALQKSKEKSKEKILNLITINPYITTREIMKECQLSESMVYKIVRLLRENGEIERAGGDKGGHWKINGNK